MITFKINGKSVDSPHRSEDVTMRQYIALLTIPSTLRDHISFFTGIPIETLMLVEIHNLETIAEALSFLRVPPEYEPGPTKDLGEYVLPEDIKIKSLGQFEALRALFQRMPKDINSSEGWLQIADLYVEACAIYLSKTDELFDESKVPQLKEVVYSFSCVEVMRTGAFFLFKPVNSFTTMRNHSRNIAQHLKKSRPGSRVFQKISDSFRSLFTKVKG
jgi:hypothetical protein